MSERSISKIVTDEYLSHITCRLKSANYWLRIFIRNHQVLRIAYCVVRNGRTTYALRSTQ